jgi:hypothetical protein
MPYVAFLFLLERWEKCVYQPPAFSYQASAKGQEKVLRMRRIVNKMTTNDDK